MDSEQAEKTITVGYVILSRAHDLSNTMWGTPRPGGLRWLT